MMQDPPVLEAPANGQPAEGALTLPPGTIQLPPPMVARLVRLLQQQPQIHDALYSYLEGKFDGHVEGAYSLVIPVVLLVKQQGE